MHIEDFTALLTWAASLSSVSYFKQLSASKQVSLLGFACIIAKALLTIQHKTEQKPERGLSTSILILFFSLFS